MQSKERQLANVSVAELMEAGVHFGHQTKRWNPKMKKFIFGARNGIHVVDLTKTLTQIEIACGFLHDIVLAGGSILLIGTKKQSQQEIRDAAARTGMPYVTDRWLGGTLTNLQTIRRSVKRMQDLDKTLEGPDAHLLPKKEAASMRREQAKLHRNLDGIATMTRPPAAAFVIDTMREQIAVHEARRLGIPIIAIVDTNADPDMATYPIAGNDDAIRAIKLITNVIAETIIEAQAELGRKTGVAAQAEPEPEPAPVEIAAPVADAAVSA